MLRTGILHPDINSLLSRVRHTNCLVLADRGFPFWPAVETIDLALVDNIPTVEQVLRAVAANFTIGALWMAEEFLRESAGRVPGLEALAGGAAIQFEPHVRFKQRVPQCIGLIRTGDTTQYANMILESA